MKTSAILLPLLLAPISLAQDEPGTVLWRFDLSTAISGSEVGVGPDGTVYASDNVQLFALAPDGSVRWSRSGRGGGRPLGFLPDGTVIGGLGETIFALDPQTGEDVWTFSYDSGGFVEQLSNGPSVGPDGNIYAVSSVSLDGSIGIGAFSLTPTGQLRWSDQGDPLIANEEGTLDSRIRFTADQMVFHVNLLRSGAPEVWAFDFNGNQSLYVDFTCTSPVRTDPQGRVILSGSCGVEPVDIDTQEIAWTVQFGAVNLTPAIGIDGTIYSGSWMGQLAALDPSGNTLWSNGALNHPEKVLGVQDDAGVVLYVGGGFGAPNILGAADAGSGAPLWETPMRTVNDHLEGIWSDNSAFSPDGSVVYFSTRFTSNGENGAVYAVRVAQGSQCPADLTGDGVADSEDFFAYLDLFAAGDAGADITGNGTIDADDFFAYLDLFAAGC